MWRTLREMTLSEWLYWILVLLVVAPQVIIFLLALAESIYYSIYAGNTLISFYLVFRYSYEFLFNGDTLAEQPWIYIVFLFGFIAIMTVVKFRTGTANNKLVKDIGGK
jgi:hypothetical protein